MARMRTVIAAVGVALLVPIAAAQTLEFEVAAIKPAQPGTQRFGPNFQGSQLRSSNTTLRQLIEFAYQIRPLLHEGKLEGGPAWMDTDGFDIAAKPPKPSTADELRAMMRALLADRFKLRVHSETRDMPVYALVPAKKDGTLGPGLRRSANDCSAFTAAVARGNIATPLRSPVCNLRNEGTVAASAFRGSAGIPVLIFVISRGEIDRPIVDRTGLTGTFDIELTFNPRSSLTARGEDVAVSDAPSLFTALPEQLGLKLEPARVPLEVIVVESAAKPATD
jgi:uncharacterized protein (TIGR03435 family)